jgi:signal transduction histidine kinase
VDNENAVLQPSRLTERARLELTQFSPDAPLNEVFARVCELCAATLDVERVGIWLFIDDGAAIRCATLYERSKNGHSAGAVLRVADFPTYFASLKLRKAVPAEFATEEPWTAELAATYMQPLGITSILDAGIFVDGKLVGVVCHEHVGTPREWTTELRDFAGSVADLLALRIQSADLRDLRAAFQTQQTRIAALDKTEALERMAAAIAHDLRNLLMIFLGRAELLSERADLPDDARQQARIIVEAALRGNELVHSLQEFARTEAQAPSVIGIAVETARFLPVLRAAAGKRHEVLCSGPDFVGKVLIDKTQYTRLLLNLVLNACDAMPHGGVVRMSLVPVKIVSNPRLTGRFALLEVADDGSGMDPNTQRRIFDPYFTTKAKGTGLGLAIVRQVVEHAGGFIRVRSAPGAGTTFSLFFPVLEASEHNTREIMLPDETETPDT